MRKIAVADMTLRVLAEEKKTLTFRERLSIASSLDACGIDTISLPAIGNLPENEVIFRTIATTLKNAAVAIDGGDTEESIKTSYTSISKAKKPIIQIVLPVSTVQMEYCYHLKASSMLSKIEGLVSFAKSICDNVEFVAKDATRAEEGFIEKVAETAYNNGATSITICDDAGVFFPEDYADLIKKIKKVSDIKVYAAPSDKLSLSAASAISAIKAGADGIATSICGSFLSSEILSDIFRAKGADLEAESSLNATVIKKTITAAKGEIPIEENEIAVVSLEALDEETTISDIASATKKLGYELSDEDIGKVFEEAKRVIAKKGKIGASELEAVIASSSMQVPSTFHVVSYVVNSGNVITATANLTLEKNGEKISGVATGDGPIDAAFHAIEQIIGHHYELDDFQIQSITKGREALGSSLVRLISGGKIYSGNGVSTDIVGASIRAYINALNKIVYEEN